MNPSQARITYLFHSGFLVETAGRSLIFDYYQPDKLQPSLANGIISADWLKNRSKVVVFSSHNHGDHFDRAILDWAKANPSLAYVLSDDIKVKTPGLNVHALGPYQTLDLDGMEIRSFGSTDQGVSFWVRAGGLSLFHAGDLNRWQWKEDTPADQAKAVEWFQAEIARIEGLPVDIAFFPVDRRLEEYYASGAEYLAAKLRPKLLIPMHFGEDYAATRAFAGRAGELGIPTVVIERRGQEIEF